MKSSSQWLQSDNDNASPVSAITPSLSPSRNGNQNSQQETFSLIAVSKPELSPSAPRPDGKRPLAPIFMRDYSRKRKPTTTDIHREVISRTSRYPERAKKNINDCNIVSDGALSDSGHDEFGPRMKKGKAGKD